ncbi:hypothetical protein E2C01_015083 [Portunus trituberculatus]|uniref:Uncharacterized protein n=1 Tax=Portunus trituberculatus TaxID=210409 RepID=A0A5B7DKV8_PORTR|nr:hypothetical protein [Portunus trituberculatus]
MVRGLGECRRGSDRPECLQEYSDVREPPSPLSSTPVSKLTLLSRATRQSLAQPKSPAQPYLTAQSAPTQQLTSEDGTGGRVSSFLCKNRGISEHRAVLG